MSELTIRNVQIGDAQRMLEIKQKAWRTTLPYADLGIAIQDVELFFERNKEKLLRQRQNKLVKLNSDANSTGWVALLGNEIVGYCTPRIREVPRIGAIFVDPDCQGKGVGSTLMDKAIDWIRKHKKTEHKFIMVRVVAYNARAIRFYEKYGFVATSEAGIHTKLGLHKIPTIIMEKPLV